MTTDPERWQQVQDLCHAALERDPAERSAFLAVACKGDDELRREVESLIAHERQADDFLSVSTLPKLAHTLVEGAHKSLVGSRIGSYEIVARIGAGGMGEVYRARDTKLHRDVAIKVLAEMFAGDAERLARFQREAVVLAALNHPHIGAIYGLEQSGVHALVLELVEGPTLTDRIARGPLSLEEAYSIASQIAAALEAAHERGIVHRDLKPANVKIRPDGTVKVLDFGLAKPPAEGPANLSWSPTLTAGGTRDGVILGTAAYMSPEQARGRAVDKRADIWAFGCVVYEMLTGMPAFDGETVSDIIAALLTRAPAWDRLPEGTPASVRRLLRRCLEKDVRRRLHDISDARLEIDDAIAGIADVSDRRLSGVSSAREVEFQRLTEFVGMKESPAVSPDGKMVAFVALVHGRRQIWLRFLAGGPALQVTHDDRDHDQPRWAPDSSTLIYYTPGANPGAEGALWEVAALGGPSRRIASTVAGGDISHDGRRIALFQSIAEHIELLTFARDGSHPERVVRLLPQYLYRSLRWSPDDRLLAFQRDTPTTFLNHLYVVPLRGGESREVARSGWLAGLSWLPHGSELVYSSSCGGTVLYPPIFNLRVISQDGRHDRQLTYGDLSYIEPDVHSSGKLLASRIRTRSDIWKFPIAGTPSENTRNGVRITQQTGQVQTPSVAPDGSEVVYLCDNGGHGNLWIATTDGFRTRQLTYERDPTVNVGVPVWSPAGDWIVFLVARGWHSTLCVIRPDGSGLRELVPNGWGPCWSQDGRWVFYTTMRDGRPRIERLAIEGGDVVLVRSDDARTVAPAPDGSSVYYLRGLTTDPLGGIGDLEIRYDGPGDGPGQRIGRISGSRVPLSPRLIQPYLSPDGQWLAFVLVDGATCNIWALPTTPGPMKQVTDFGERSILIARSVSWSSDSQFLYAAVAEPESEIVLLDGLIH